MAIGNSSYNRKMRQVSEVKLGSLILGASLALLVMISLDIPKSSFVKCEEQLSIESRQQKDSEDLTDTIKYLEKLDKYFSQMARPRFGRSDYKQPPLGTRLLLSGTNGQFLNRPLETPTRFGSLVDLLRDNMMKSRKYYDLN